MEPFSENHFVKYAIFFNSYTENGKFQSSRNNGGCGCMTIIAIVGIGICLWGVANSTSNDNNDTYSSKEIIEEASSIDAPTQIELLREDSLQPYNTMHEHLNIQQAPRFSAQTVREAYDEGYDHGFDDGEEDGMNNDKDASYDESNPYVGKMKKSYIDGYQQGYEDGKEEGIDVYNEDRDPGEEEEDW